MPKTSIIITMTSYGISKLSFISINYFNYYLLDNALDAHKTENLLNKMFQITKC